MQVCVLFVQGNAVVLWGSSAWHDKVNQDISRKSFTCLIVYHLIWPILCLSSGRSRAQGSSDGHIRARGSQAGAVERGEVQPGIVKNTRMLMYFTFVSDYQSVWVCLVW